MTKQRYRKGEGESIEDQCLIDTKDDTYFFVSNGLGDIVIRLNKQDAIIRSRTKELDAIRRQLKKEIDNSEGELKQALIRISNTELDI